MNDHLFVDHRLNYFEALRRMAYWIDQARSSTDTMERKRAFARVDLLRMALQDKSDNLYMEGR